MVGGAAGHDIYLAEPLDVLFCHGDPIQPDAAVFVQTPVQRFVKALGLFVDFFNHKVIVALFFGGIGIPRNVEHLALDFVSLGIEQFDFVLCQKHHFVVFDQVDSPHVLQQRRNIRSDEIASFTQPHHQRAVLAHGHNFIRLFAADHAQSVSAPHVLHSLIHGIQQIAAVENADQMCDDLRVGLRTELHAVIAGQPFLQLHKVFDDAVVHHRNRAVAVGMGMGVQVGRRPVSGPAGMTDPQAGAQLLFCNRFFQVGNAPLALSYSQTSARAQGDARRIVASVF